MNIDIKNENGCLPSIENSISLIEQIKNVLFPNFYGCNYSIEETIENIKKIIKRNSAMSGMEIQVPNSA